MVLWSPLVENWQEQPFNVTFLLLLYSSYYFICIKNVWLLINLWLHSGLDLLHFSPPLQDKVWKMHTCHTGHGILCKFESRHSFSGEQQLFPGMVPKPGKQNLSFLASNYIEIVRGSLSVTVGGGWDAALCLSFHVPAARQSMTPKTLIRWAGNNYGFTAPRKETTLGKGGTWEHSPDPWKSETVAYKPT